MAVINRDLTVVHRLQKSAQPVEVRLSSGDQIRILQEWERLYLVKIADGKVFSIPKECVDPDG